MSPLVPPRSFTLLCPPPSPTALSPLSLHDALPILLGALVHLLPGHLRGVQRLTGKHGRRRVEPAADRLRNVDRIPRADRKSTRLNSSHVAISYAVFCLKKKKSIIIMNNKRANNTTT